MKSRIVELLEAARVDGATERVINLRGPLSEDRVEREVARVPVVDAGRPGVRARAGIEELLGQRVHLDLHVKVAKDWQRDPKQLRRLGF